MTDRLSICIPVFNKSNFTKSCLQDLCQLDKDKNEIIIIDNDSKDNTEEVVRSFMKDHYNIIYIRNDKNYGFAQACNRGYNASHYANVLFLNNDIRVKCNHNNWTDLLINELEEDTLVGPTGGKVDPKTFQFLYETNDSKKDINYMSGWCLAGNKRTFNKLIINNYIGPFSEEFGIAYFEDTDMGFRSKKLKFKFKLVQIPVIHFGKISSSQLNTNKLYTEARKIFINKWKVSK